MVRISSSALAACLALWSCSAGAQQSRPAAPPVTQQEPAAKAKEPRAAVDPHKFALIVAGAGGEESFTKKFTSQAMQLYDAVTMRLGFDEKHVRSGLQAFERQTHGETMASRLALRRGRRT